jgi:hypothetical protein
MTVRRSLQSPVMGLCAAILIVWACGVGVSIAGALNNPEPNLRNRDVLGSARLVVAALVFGWSLMILDITPASFVRLEWTLGLLASIIHIVLAFWLSHGWSHNAAVDHVREVGGFGGGIVVNYCFELIWLGDVVWWWINPTSHSNRPKWMRWVIHGFLAFVLLNATVIFGSPELRILYAALFLILAIMALTRLFAPAKTH